MRVRAALASSHAVCPRQTLPAASGGPAAGRQPHASGAAGLLRHAQGGRRGVGRSSLRLRAKNCSIAKTEFCARGLCAAPPLLGV